jgi:integrase
MYQNPPKPQEKKRIFFVSNGIDKNMYPHYSGAMIKQEHALELVARPAVPAPHLAADQRRLAEAWAVDLQARAAAGLLSARTPAAYVEAVEGWLAYLAAAAVSMPTPAHVLAYVAHLRAGHAPATVNARLAAVRSLYAWAETQNAYPAIGRSVKALPVRKDEPLDCLPPESVAALLDKVDGDTLAALRDRALVHCLFSTACRLVSVAAANVEDLDLVDGALVYGGKGDRGQKARKAYLPPSALDALRRYLSARRAAAGGDLPLDAPLFAAVGNRAGGRRMTTRSLRRVVVGLMESAGHIRRDPAGKIERPGIYSAHSLRRSGITCAFDAQGLEAAQTLAGHADPKTTLRAYARVQKGRVLRGLTATMDLDRRRLG